MKIETTRFGQVEVTDEHFIEFRDGMVGFSKLKRFVLVESPAMPLILWLQSVDLPDIAFPLIEPWFFKRDYKPQMSDADRHALAHAPNNLTKTFVVLTIPEDMARMTVNMKAPVVLNIDKGTGTQLILQDRTLEVREPAHEAFSKAVSNFSINQSVTDFDADAGDAWAPVNVRNRADQVV